MGISKFELVYPNMPDSIIAICQKAIPKAKLIMKSQEDNPNNEFI